MIANWNYACLLLIKIEEWLRNMFFFRNERSHSNGCKIGFLWVIEPQTDTLLIYSKDHLDRWRSVSSTLLYIFGVIDRYLNLSRSSYWVSDLWDKFWGPSTSFKTFRENGGDWWNVISRGWRNSSRQFFGDLRESWDIFRGDSLLPH